jgi:serine protease Do
MNGLIFNAALGLSMLAAQTISADCFSNMPYVESYGYSSDESFGGGSSYLGVDTRDITPERMSALKLKEERGVEVTMVDQDAPAGKAGIKEHDVILSINETPVESVEQLRRLIREVPPGRVVAVGISRDGQVMTLKAQLTDRKQAFFSTPGVRAFTVELPRLAPLPMMPDIDMPMTMVVVHSSARSGLMVENITPQLGTFFGAKNGQGVLVRSVEKGSAAEKAGFHAGDVIVRVNGEAVSDTGDFSHSLRARKEATVSIGILRDKKEQTLTLTLPGREQSELRRERIEVPELNAETRAEMEKFRSQMAQLKPEMMKYAEEIKRIRPEVEALSKETSEQRQQLQEEMKDLERDLRDHQQELQEQIRHELQPGHADI